MRTRNIVSWGAVGLLLAARTASAGGLVQLVMIKYPNYHAARAGAAAMTLATDFVDQLNGCAC
jgi:hypothetical protein